MSAMLLIIAQFPDFHLLQILLQFLFSLAVLVISSLLLDIVLHVVLVWFGIAVCCVDFAPALPLQFPISFPTCCIPSSKSKLSRFFKMKIVIPLADFKKTRQTWNSDILRFPVEVGDFLSL